MKKIFTVVFICIIIGTILSCIEKKDDESDLDSIVVAEVGDAKLTRGKLNQMLEVERQKTPNIYKHKITPEMIIDRWIERKLLSQEARRLGYDEDEEVIEKVKTYEDMVLLNTLWEKEIKEKVEVSEEEVREFYEKHKNTDYRVKDEKVLFSTITVRTAMEAEEVIKQARQGVDFKELEREYDIQFEKPEENHYYSSTEIPNELVDTVFNMKPGEVSGPVKYSVGYMVIKLKDHIYPGEYIPYEFIEEQLHDRALKEKQMKAAGDYVERLKTKTDIITYMNKYEEAERKAQKEEPKDNDEEE